MSTTTSAPSGTAEPTIRLVSTGTPATRALGAVTLAAMAALLVFALVLSPPDVDQGDAVRLVYMHVPTVWLAFFAFFVTALCSLLYLIRKTRSLAWDRIAGASAEIGVLYTALTLVVGMVYGRATWGVYWTWDARLTTTALLFVLYLGYLAIRRLPASPESRARRCAIAGLIAFIDVPIVHESVTWWRTLHQKSTLLRANPEMDGLMLFTVYLGVTAFTLAYVWFMMHRCRVAMMEEAIEEHGLELALEERRAEAEVAVEGLRP
jgi:heme exporter protein C